MKIEGLISYLKFKTQSIANMLILICSLMIPVSAFAQSYNTDFEAIHNAYYKNSLVISFKVSFAYYSNPGSEKMLDSMSGHYWMQGDEFYYKLGKQEYLKNNAYYLNVDHEEKIVLIGNPANSPYQAFSLLVFDSLIKSSSVFIKPLKGNEHEKGYRISGMKGDIEAAELWFESDTYHITRLVLNFGKHDMEGATHFPHVVITYSQFAILPSKQSANLFSEKKFITQTEGKPVLSNLLKGYSLLIQ